jgi:aminopeptidase YwaD
MNSIKYTFLTISLLVLTLPACVGQEENSSKSYYEMIDQNFDQQAAFETVKFVQQFWRVPGNSGFDKSIYHAADQLEKAGFILEENASDNDRLVYRIEKRPMKNTTWEPVSGYLNFSSGEELLNFETNRHMVTINSYSTNGEKEFEVVYVGEGRNLDFSDVKGKLVYGAASVRSLYKKAVIENGAVGVIGYSLPSYLQPEKNQNSIQFSSISRDPENKSFGLLLSYAAKKKIDAALKAGKIKVKVNLETKVYNADELTLVAELKGSKLPNERFVFSAHVQEPGANDNASGVGALTEVAIVSAELLKQGKIDPERTITYLFGDEISSTNRFIQEDKVRAADIKWGMSLDMVGENTDVTGGTFLIEKMPDPGAIWTRGIEKHSEWGGRPLTKERLKPHYFNDLVINQFKWLGAQNNWVVKFNPYEGGSDHVPFLNADIPGLLLWHFTDQFYHTDQDRINKVSPKTLKNVGTGALMVALLLTENNDQLAFDVLEQVVSTAKKRLEEEVQLSLEIIASGGDLNEQRDIIETWTKYYQDVFQTILDLNPQNLSEFEKRLSNEGQEFSSLSESLLDRFKN